MKSKCRFLLAVLTVACVSGCDRGRTYAPSSVFTERGILTELTENSVRVTVSLEADSAGKPVIRATFTPTEAGFHLYSKDIPAEGVKGLGRPTRLEIMSGVLKPAGPVFSDVKPHDLDGLPVYPEGPVILRQPVEITSGGDTSSQIEITFMACSAKECKPPVERKRINLKLPKG